MQAATGWEVAGYSVLLHICVQMKHGKVKLRDMSGAMSGIHRHGPPPRVNLAAI
jgi:hypothetical protein